MKQTVTISPGQVKKTDSIDLELALIGVFICVLMFGAIRECIKVNREHPSTIENANKNVNLSWSQYLQDNDNLQKLKVLK